MNVLLDMIGSKYYCHYWLLMCMLNFKDNFQMVLIACLLLFSQPEQQRYSNSYRMLKNRVYDRFGNILSWKHCVTTTKKSLNESSIQCIYLSGLLWLIKSDNRKYVSSRSRRLSSLSYPENQYTYIALLTKRCRLNTTFIADSIPFNQQK